MSSCKLVSELLFFNAIGCIMVSVLAPSVVDRWVWTLGSSI